MADQNGKPGPRSEEGATHDYTVKDSGERQVFATGAQRDAQVGKGRFDLLPAQAMTRLAVHFEKGAAKYGDNNYLKGIPLRRYLDSAMRHMFKYMQGLDDEDHLVAAAWNLVACLETESRIRHDALPKNLADIGPYVTQETGQQTTAGV